MGSWRLSIILALSLSCISTAKAVVVDHLYRGAVTVASVGQHAKEQALQQALAQVLIKISGDSTIVDDSVVKPLLSKPGQYLEEYRYQHINGHNKLFATFQAPLLQQLLAQTSFPAWGHNRPLVLLWLAERNGDQQQLLANDDDNNADVKLVRKIASNRGLPIILPMLDLDEMNTLSPTDIWNVNLPMLNTLAERYYPNIQFVVRIAKGIDSWDANGSLLFNGKRIDLQASAANEAQAITQIMNQGADAIAKNYSLDNAMSGSQDVLLNISNVHGFSTFTSIEKYLHSFAEVKDVNVVAVSPSHIQVQVNVEGGAAELVQALSLDQRLVLVSKGAEASAQAASSTTPALAYRWNVGKTAATNASPKPLVTSNAATLPSTAQLDRRNQ